MSKYLGKLLLESGAVSDSVLQSVLVKYVKQNDMFCFRYAGAEGGGIFYVGSEVVFMMCEFRGYLECQYQWSVGYTVRPLKGIESLRTMRDEELTLLGGRRALMLSGRLDNDDDFNMLCAIQYKFKFSEFFFRRVRGHFKRNHDWVLMQEKALGHAGRKAGSKNSVDESSECETVSEVIERCEWNMSVAVKRGILEWYIEANKELCKVTNQRFDKDKCLEKWNELRKNEGF